ncbi:MAG: hypothetical protein M3P93_13845, partial [Actinomycetota bacterium]|nr:hypothetical protein [Actinomycetota bacterium]
APAGAGGPSSSRPVRPARLAPPPQVRGWSTENLVTVGVPAAVLEHLVTPPTPDDLGWLVALAGAITAVVPPPAEPDEAHPVVVSGHGLTGALAVLEAASRGTTPGTITHAGRTAPATATELALVVRHHVQEA